MYRVGSVLMILLAALAVVRCDSAGQGYTSRSTDEVTPRDVSGPKQINALQLEAGDCIGQEFTDGLIEDAVVVDCSSDEAVGRVTKVIDLTGTGDEAYPGDDFLRALAESECDVTTGMFRYLYPSELSWTSGDRSITCVASI